MEMKPTRETVHSTDGLVLHWMKHGCRPHATAAFSHEERACDVHRTAGWMGPKLWSKQNSLSATGKELRSLSPAGLSLDPQLITQKILISVKVMARLLPTRRPRVQIPDREPVI